MISGFNDKVFLKGTATTPCNILKCTLILRPTNKQTPAHLKQHSKLTFWKSRLLATFNIIKWSPQKKFWSPKKKLIIIIIIIITVISRGGHFVYVTWTSTTPSDTFATLSFAQLLRLRACRLKHCSNGREKEKEEISMSGNKNDLLQSCWDRVKNRQWHAKPFKSIKLTVLICREDQVNN